jgi:hypothetical protein
MRGDTLDTALLEGDEDLEVVGESHRQANLRRVVGGQHRPEVHVRMDVYAMLLAEDGNPYDPNAVSVWISGLMVGYLPREQVRTSPMTRFAGSRSLGMRWRRIPKPVPCLGHLSAA